MKKKITDSEVAEFLVAFKERSKEEQERSVVWQELVSFPEWGMAKFVPKAPEANPEIPDPRKSASDRAKEMREKNPVTDTGKGKPEPGAMTTANTPPGQPNPWSDSKPPKETGPCFLGVRTDVPPPFPGKWERLSDGWFRKE